MNKRFSYDNMIKSRSIEPSDIIRTFKLDRCCDFMEEKYNNPRLTQKEICNQLGFSDRAIRRYRDDIKMVSPYRSNNNKKKKPKQTPININNNNTKSLSEQDIRDKRIEKGLKNKLKGGNISDTHSLSGKELIVQAFVNDKNTILENNQKDNTKLITIARRLADEY